MSSIRQPCGESSKRETYLLLGSRLLDNLFGLGRRRGLLLELRRQLVAVLVLDEVTGSNSVLQRKQKGGIQPLLLRRKLTLHKLLDGDHGRPRAVLELGDGFDDSSFVRHSFGR